MTPNSWHNYFTSIYRKEDKYRLHAPEVGFTSESAISSVLEGSRPFGTFNDEELVEELKGIDGIHACISGIGIVYRDGAENYLAEFLPLRQYQIEEVERIHRDLKGAAHEIAMAALQLKTHQAFGRLYSYTPESIQAFGEKHQKILAKQKLKARFESIYSPISYYKLIPAEQVYGDIPSIDTVLKGIRPIASLTRNFADFLQDIPGINVAFSKNGVCIIYRDDSAPEAKRYIAILDQMESEKEKGNTRADQLSRMLRYSDIQGKYLHYTPESIASFNEKIGKSLLGLKEAELSQS